MTFGHALSTSGSVWACGRASSASAGRSLRALRETVLLAHIAAGGGVSDDLNLSRTMTTPPSALAVLGSCGLASRLERLMTLRRNSRCTAVAVHAFAVTDNHYFLTAER
jgi:hypothetical protein